MSVILFGSDVVGAELNQCKGAAPADAFSCFRVLQLFQNNNSEPSPRTNPSRPYQTDGKRVPGLFVVESAVRDVNPAIPV